MSSLSLFSETDVDAPVTEGVKYAGSKLKLLPHILSLIKKTGARTVLDGFSGTTRVSQALAKSGYTVVANDIAAWSQVFGTCYLLNIQDRRHYQGLIDHLNGLPPKDGWFTEHYGGDVTESQAPQEDGLKKPWQRHNTRKLDAVREEIDRLSLSTVDRAVALASLMLAMDRVDSTLGHFSSYLREWAQRSFGTAMLEVPRLFANEREHRVLRGDAIDAASTDVDLAYYDPPYGSNNEKMPPSRVRYAAYYHVWTTIVLNDKPTVFGKTCRREDASDTVSPSAFEDFRRNPVTDRFTAVEAVERLISSTCARWVVLSYSSGGRATAHELQEVLLANGNIIEVVELCHKRHVMAGMTWTNEWIKEIEAPNREFLFLLDRAGGGVKSVQTHETKPIALGETTAV